MLQTPRNADLAFIGVSRPDASPTLQPDAAAAGGIRSWRKFFSPSQVSWIVSGAAWSWGRIREHDAPVNSIHRSYQRHCWQQSGVGGRVLSLAGFVAGVPLVLAQMLRVMRKRGKAVRRETGKGLLRQLAEQTVLWLGSGVLPRSYYAFELYDGDRRRTALDYLYRLETKSGIYPLLREHFSSARTTEALRSKAAFALHCEQHGVAAVPALFVVEAGSVTRLDGGCGGVPRCDLFLKPLSGSGGRGAAIWRFAGDGTWRNRDAGLVSEDAFLEHLTDLSAHEPYVGRLYVTSHPAIADLSPGALSSVRVVTCLDENQRPEATHAVLRMASTLTSIVDNFHAGGIASHVDMETGEIGAATDLGLSRNTQWWDSHPVTYAKIRGRRIPMWEEVLDLVHRAHEAFPDHVVVGWDVAILEDGPKLIEGNKSPDLDIVQRTGRAPVGNSRLGVLIAHHLGRALALRDGEREPSQRPAFAPRRGSISPATAKIDAQGSR